MSTRVGRCHSAILGILLFVASGHLQGQISISPLLIPKLTIAGPARPSDPATPAVLFGVGDIGWCADIAGTHATGALMERLLETTPGSIGFTVGDNSNDTGSEDDYGCLDNTPWGRLASRLRTVPGNPDYEHDAIQPYYLLYFLKAGGPQGHGYYSYDVGGWHVLALNSALMRNSPIMHERRQAQLDWVARDLREHPAECTLAYFHRPPFSSGKFASPAWVMPLFDRLYRAGVDLLITGHEHFFAAYPPLDQHGAIDEACGIEMLTVGTGGAPFFNDPHKRKYHEMLLPRVLGVVKVTLAPGRFDWAFIDTEEKTPRCATGRSLSGHGTCHRPPATS